MSVLSTARPAETSHGGDEGASSNLCLSAPARAELLFVSAGFVARALDAEGQQAALLARGTEWRLFDELKKEATSMRPLLGLSILLVVLFSGDGHAWGTGRASVGAKACHLKSVPIEHQVNHLTIHPDAHVVAYTFVGEIGRAGGFRAIDYASGAEVDALPARSQHYVHMKISPSGRRLAFVQTEKGESALKIGHLDGSNAKVCAASSSYYRPLAFSFDEQLLLALSSQGNDHQIILCNSAGGMLRSWATTTVLERVKEFLTPRFHGRPSWMVDTASLSTDGKQILSVRTDGQLVVWDTNGTRLHESTVKHFPLGSSDRLVAFGEDGAVFTFSRTTTDRQGRTPLIVSTLFPEQKRFEVLREARVRAAPGTDHVYLYATRQELYLVYLKPSGVAIVSARSGEAVADVPVTAAVSALSVSQDGTMLGVAQLGSLELWQLAQEGTDARRSWLRRVAITEIDSPHFRGRGRLTGGEPTRSCPRNLPPARPGFPEASTGSRVAARGLEGFDDQLRAD